MDAYTFIREAIIIGRFSPGMRLAEESLAKEMNISRTPVREAIRQLEAEGLVVPLKRGVGVRRFTREDIRQIYDLRTLLEGYAASQAAIHRSEDDLEAMQKANRLYEEAIVKSTKGNLDIVRDIVAANQTFHEAIVKAARNEHIHFHISKVVVVPVIFRSFYWYNDFQLRRSLEVHRTIVTAIRERESERATIAMHEHIYQGRDHVLNQWKELETIQFLQEVSK